MVQSKGERLANAKQRMKRLRSQRKIEQIAKEAAAELIKNPSFIRAIQNDDKELLDAVCREVGIKTAKKLLNKGD